MKEQIDLVISGATLMTVDQERRIIKDGTVAVRGSEILEVGKAKDVDGKYDAAKTIDGEGRVVLPGIFDSHVHLSSSLVKSLIYGEPIPLGLTYMPFGEALDEEQVYVAALLSCIDRLKNGVTYIGDVGSKYPDQVAKAVRDMGMKATISFGMRTRRSPISLILGPCLQVRRPRRPSGTRGASSTGGTVPPRDGSGWASAPISGPHPTNFM